MKQRKREKEEEETERQGETEPHSPVSLPETSSRVWSQEPGTQAKWPTQWQELAHLPPRCHAPESTFAGSYSRKPQPGIRLPTPVQVCVISRASSTGLNIYHLCIIFRTLVLACTLLFLNAVPCRASITLPRRCTLSQQWDGTGRSCHGFKQPLGPATAAESDLLLQTV